MDKKFTLNRKLFKNNNQKLTQREYIELLRNYNNFASKKKINDDIKNQNNKTEISPNITQRNQFLKQSNSTININEKTEKNEKKEREILNSKTPERIIILTKRAPQNTIKNVFKHYRSPPIIYQPENGDNLIKKKIEKNNVIRKEKTKEKDEMSTLSTSNISTPVKNEDRKYNKLTNTKTNNFIKYQRNLNGKFSITPDRTLNNKNNFTQRETLSTSVDNKRNDKGNNIISHEKEYQTLNLEDLIMIEDKFNNIVKNVYNKNFQVVSKICFEWWNFYFNCSLKGSCEYFFNNNQIKNIIFSQNSLLLISIIFVYDLSFKDTHFYKCYEIMKNILFLNHQNFLIICQYLLSRIRKEYLKIRWVELLKTIIQKRLNNNNSTIIEIEQNLLQLNKLLKILLQTQNQIINPKIIEIFNNYNSLSSNIINKIFMTNILHIDNESGSLLFSNLRDSIPNTYNNYIIKNPPLKPLTLVLDLDETLMSFVYTKENKGQGILRIRPYLYQFLLSVKEYYEIIIFTASTQNYADSILDAIEEFKGQFFNFRLYRNHCSILDNDFVKDISLIGRDLSKTIIVDNMQQNFKLQKENGILISSFWGEDVNDKALLQLGRILVGFGKEMRNFKYNYDIRQLILKYKDDIVKNVSMG